MGIEANNQDEIEQEDLETEVEETEVDEGAEDESENDESEESESTEESDAAGDEDDSVDVVHADDADTANTESNKPKPPRRIRKLLERTERLQAENAGKDAENQLLRMQLERVQQQQQEKQKPKPPTLAECGYDESKHAEAVATWAVENAVPSVFSKQAEEYQKQEAQQQAKAARTKALESHYERADGLKVKDYDDAEQKAIEVLGKELVEDIAANADDSHMVLYYLGKNPAKAEELKQAFATNAAKGTYALGKIAAGLQIKPGPKKPTLEPDTPVDGAGPAGGTWEKRIEKARERANKTGDMTEVVKLKKQAREAGVNL